MPHKIRPIAKVKEDSGSSGILLAHNALLPRLDDPNGVLLGAKRLLEFVNMAAKNGALSMRTLVAFVDR